MYDALFVGAGLTAATICSQMKGKWKILVLDVENYLGGNCHDYKKGNNYMQSHGPHNFHDPDGLIFDFLSRYTEWIDFEYTVTAEIRQDGKIKRVPFPYSEQTRKLTGELDEQQILDLFFKEYSAKMWGKSYEDLPELVKNRVPKNTAAKSVFFPGQIQAQPKLGYTHMIENMFDGAEIMLNADPRAWEKISAYNVFYSGRPDMLVDGPKLEFRTLKIRWEHENWDADTVSVNYCHDGVEYTRKTNYGMYYRNKNNVISYEIPMAAKNDDLLPYYPIETKNNLYNYNYLKNLIAVQYPNLHLIGRLGCFHYIDMFMAVKEGLGWISKFK